MNVRAQGGELLHRVLGLHPVSALLAVAIDWLLFGSNALGLGVGVMIAFLLSLPIAAVVAKIQNSQYGDKPWPATLKGLVVAGLICIPTPVFSAPVILSGLLGGLALRSTSTRTE